MQVLRREIGKQAVRYLAVGALGYAADVAIFNALSIWFADSNQDFQPLINKAFSTSVGMFLTYILNGSWTFADRKGRGEGLGRFALYVAVNLAGLLLALTPLYVSRYLLGFDSLLADNISANVIGAAFGVVFRFLANRSLVFAASKSI